MAGFIYRWLGGYQNLPCKYFASHCPEVAWLFEHMPTSFHLLYLGDTAYRHSGSPKQFDNTSVGYL